MKSAVYWVQMLTVMLGGFAGLAGFGVVFHIVWGTEAAGWVGAFVWGLLVAASVWGEVAYGYSPKPRK